MIRKQTKIWKTKDGRKIRICDMDEQHLKNTLAMLERNAEVKRRATQQFYSLCVGPSGDMAQMAFEQEQIAAFDSDIEDYLPDIYENMALELARRTDQKEFKSKQ